MAKKPFFEGALEGGLFASRWLMAPFYVGLIAALVALMVVFFQELAHQLPMLWTFDPVTHVYAMTANDAIMLALSLIDLSLAGNLVLIVMFSGYRISCQSSTWATTKTVQTGWARSISQP